jgi:hypothetical protein
MHDALTKQSPSCFLLFISPNECPRPGPLTQRITVPMALGYKQETRLLIRVMVNGPRGISQAAICNKRWTRSSHGWWTWTPMQWPSRGSPRWQHSPWPAITEALSMAMCRFGSKSYAMLGFIGLTQLRNSNKSQKNLKSPYKWMARELVEPIAPYC